jgi:hypothetical protein
MNSSWKYTEVMGCCDYNANISFQLLSNAFDRPGSELLNLEEQEFLLTLVLFWEVFLYLIINVVTWAVASAMMALMISLTNHFLLFNIFVTCATCQGCLRRSNLQ